MQIAVFGAVGHTGKFVVAELLRRLQRPIAIGRASSLAGAFASRDVDVREASLDDAALLERALTGARAVINCAGPFLDTARPVIEAALALGIHYIDVTAEQESARATLRDFDAAARARGVVLLPAAGFFGGLGDLLATAAMDDWAAADRIDVAVALDRWRPTLGTRRTGARNTAPRLVFANGAFEPLAPSAAIAWDFPEPFGTQEAVELPFTETILLSTHANAPEIRSYLNRTALDNVRDPATPPPVAADESGRSAQRFAIDAIVRKGRELRRAGAYGRDIYAVTAPIVVEAARRLCEGDVTCGGAFALGDFFDAATFLHALERSGAIEVDMRLRASARRPGSS